MKQDMSTTYGIKKQVTRLMAGSSHTLSLLMSMLRVSLEAAWSMAGVWLKPRIAISLLLLFIVGSGNVWGQEGVWYIANDNTSNGHPGKVYSSASDTEKYYLVPASNPQQTSAIDAYYSPNHSTTNGDPEKPFLATALTNKDLNSIWIVKESDESGYYFIIHALTGQYVIYEVPLPNDPNTPTA